MGILQQQVAPQPAQQQVANKPEVIGLENIDLKNVPLVDLKQLEPEQGGYNFTWLGAVKLEGQWGPYYLVGVKDQNENIFKFFSNKQIANMIDEKKEPFDQIGSKFFISCRLKPGMKYTTKNGDEREAKGYSYNFTKI